MRVFIDSDVVISSLLSASGAAYFLLHSSQIQPVISSVSVKELRLVTARMDIKLDRLETLIEKRIEIIPLAQDLNAIKKKYTGYVTDINDAHIIAGAHQAKVKYLISYNLRHFHSDRIKDQFGILVLTPALFLQYLRSQ